MHLGLKILAAEHLPLILELGQQCFDSFWGPAAYQAELTNAASYTLGLLTPEKQLLGAGCLSTVLEEAHLIFLAVHPQQRRQGLGELLVLTLLDVAQKLGQAWVTLEVAASNTAALRLYDQQGFQVQGRRKHYYAETGEDALILTLPDLGKAHTRTRLALRKQSCMRRLQEQGWDIETHPAWHCSEYSLEF
jgi:ribosomal-protein-alanine N-acetyltransferase